MGCQSAREDRRGVMGLRADDPAGCDDGLAAQPICSAEAGGVAPSSVKFVS